MPNQRKIFGKPATRCDLLWSRAVSLWEEPMKRLSVLLIDDNPMLTSLLTDYLQQQPELQVLHDSQEPSNRHRDANVLLFNLRVPIWQGLERITQLRALYPEAGIIVLVPQPPSQYGAAALAAGADGFVPRATVTSDLLPRLRQWLPSSAGKQRAARSHQWIVEDGRSGRDE